jgi:hypothetical protein
MKSVVAFGLCLVLFSLFAGDKGLSALLQARREERALSRQVSALRLENASEETHRGFAPGRLDD